MIKQSLTGNQLIEMLQRDFADKLDLEIFVNNGEQPDFYGLTNAFVIASASQDKQYLTLLAGGDKITV